MANLFDSLAESAQSQQPNWPPYNIEKEGETNYRITMAVAGFSEADLDITLHEQMLIISGAIQMLRKQTGENICIAALPAASLSGASSWPISFISSLPS